MNQSNTQKRTYQKPYLVIESLQMATSIAAGCGTTVNAAVDTCRHDIGGGLTVFSVGVCDEDWESLDGKIFCYNNPSEAQKLFMS